MGEAPPQAGIHAWVSELGLQVAEGGIRKVEAPGSHCICSNVRWGCNVD